VFSGHALELWHDRVLPGQEIIEPGLRVTVDDAADNVGQVGVRLDAEQLAAFDQRCDDRPMLGTAIGAGEQSVFAGQGNHGVILPVSGRK
jgi:hypothetical protein